MARRRFPSSRLPKRNRLREQIRLGSRRLRHESLERRELLAGPELLAIRPDASALLQEQATLDVAPREFNLLFQGGADIDESTVDNNSVRLVRSGGDGTFGDGNEVDVSLGYVGFVDPGDTDPANLQRIVVRPASSAAANATDPSVAFPDDTYQLQILGSGAAPLANLAGEAFNDGTDYARTFRLDRGAQVVSIVPQPVSRNTQQIVFNGGVSGGTYQLTFRGETTGPIAWDAPAAAVQGELEALPGDVIRPGDIRVTAGLDVIFQGHYAGEQVPLIAADGGGLNQGEVNVVRSAALSQASDQIVVYFDEQPLDPVAATDPSFYRLVDNEATLGSEDDQTLLPALVTYDPENHSAVLTFAGSLPEGNYRLDIGASDEANDTASTALQVGTLFDGNRFVDNGFLGDRGGVHDDASDLDLYEVQLAASSNIDVVLTPHQSTVDLSIRLLDASLNEVPSTVTTGGVGNPDTLSLGSVPADGRYFLEVSSANGGTGSYAIDVNVTGNAISLADDNTTVTDATELGILGAAGVALTAQIEPQPIALPPYPGGNDEPGHRQIQAETHISAVGTTPRVPAGISTVSYHFPDNLGTDPFGNPYQNLITEEEKQIVRSIFEIYASVSGYEFVETASSGRIIAKGDLRAFDAGIGPNSGVAGLGGPGGVLINAALYSQATREFGDGFTDVTFHEIGHSIGLGHSYELPSVQGSGVPNDVLPGDHDIVHLQRIATPNSTDIDLHRFEVTSRGRLTAETVAERLSDEGRQSSLLDTMLKLYRETPTGEIELVASNDNYFGNDSFLELTLEPGTYFLGVSSTGNDAYDPQVEDSGFGGTTDGVYDLRIAFAAEREGALVDTDGTAFDGDADGVPGGVHRFWFQSSDATIFVDKLNDSTANVVDGDGSLADPYDTVDYALRQAGQRIVVPDDALQTIENGDQFTVNDGLNAVTFEFQRGGVATPGTYLVDIAAAASAADVAAEIDAAVDAAKTASALDAAVTATLDGATLQLAQLDNLDLSSTSALLNAPNLVRIVGNAGPDQDLGTLADNEPYLIGFDTSGDALPDGAEFLVPQGVTTMIAAGTLMKLRKANLDAGTSSANISRSHGAIQLLGTPLDPVVMRSYHNDAVGGDSDGVGGQVRSGDFGGIVFREDSDLEGQGVFLNYVNHADINNGGGKVAIDSQEFVFSPIHIDKARPTVSFNTIANSAAGAMSANPDSFDDSLGRIGPDIQGNFLSDNTIDGLFIRIETELGSRVEKLTVPGRFDDADVTHVLTENLQIDGQPGGPIRQGFQLVGRSAGRLVVDPGVVLKLSDARIEAERGSSSLIAEGTPNRPVIFTSINDDRFGGSGSFDNNGNGFSQGAAGDWSGIILNHTSSASIDHAVITFGGGDSPIEGDSRNFNAIEVHQADLRLTNSLLQDNAGGNAAGTRQGRGNNQDATIYVRGSQPVIINNIFQGNQGPVLNLNANALKFTGLSDPGRSTGSAEVFSQFADNHGPLVRLNRLGGNDINGMLVRGETLTTETIWDDTDIVHVLGNEIVVGNHHTFSGLRLQSSKSESLVVKLAGNNAGMTASGDPLDIDDRIGGTVHVLGTVGHPVVLTHLADDSVGAGLTPAGLVMLDTNGDGTSSGVPGGWRGMRFDEFSNDRNVAIVRELESPLTEGNDVNRSTTTAQFLGTLAPDQKSGDENRRLGFEVKGFVSPDDTEDVDVYSFRGTAGTEVWLDADRTDPTLDLVIEVINATGTVLARSISVGAANNLNTLPLRKELLEGGDFYTQNFRDPGFRYTLPGNPGDEGTYFVRVRSNPVSAPSIAHLNGESSGEYQLQVRQQQKDEFPGSTVRFADIRFAQTGIDIRGLPAHSPLIAEAGEPNNEVNSNNVAESPTQLVNLLQSDMAALGIAGDLRTDTDVDWYEFQLDHSDIQFIPGVNDGAGTASLVFDLDYADGAVRADSTIAVYDANQELVFVGRESNVEDDQPGVGQGPDIDDLSRGSLGNKDPFIGPVHFTVGYENGGAGIGPDQLTYYVAVMSNRSLPLPASQTLVAYPVTNDANQSDPADDVAMLTRLEPINSLTRVVEDHIGFQGYRSYGQQIDPQTDGIFDISSSIALENYVRPFSLQDVVLYAATDSAFGDDGDRLYTVDPFAGGQYLTRVTGDNWLVNGQNDLQDIVMRSDGRLYGYQRLNNNTGSVGALVEIDPETGGTTVVGNDNILGRNPTPNIRNLANDIDNRAEQFTTSDEVDALAFERLGTTGVADAPVPEYDLYYSVRESNNASKLYRARPNGDATAAEPANGNQEYGFLGDIQPIGVTFASYIINVVDNSDPANLTRIRVESKIPGTAGNAIALNITRPNNNNANVTSVSGTTINLQIGGTGGPPPTNGPSAAAIVNAINNDEDARRLVTAVIVGGNANNQGDGNDGTAAASVTSGVRVLSGGSDDNIVAPLNGRVTGLSFGDYFSNSNLFGVTSAGEVLEINENTGDVLKRLDIAAALGDPSVRFSGLTLGPQNVEGAAYKHTLFAITEDDRLFAIDSEAVEDNFGFGYSTDATDPSDLADVEAVLRPIFDNGFGSAGAVSTQVNNMQARAVGLAFSPLDFNLWHPTMKRASNLGHGINAAPDDSRDPGDEDINIADPGPGPTRDSDQRDGGASFHFGFERYENDADQDSETYLTYHSGERSQLGILEEAQQIDLSSNPAIQGTYNLPGGALGSLQSSSFSLLGYELADRPALYFNYFLETQEHPGSAVDTDGDNPFRDSARVFASRNGGVTWELLATNSSRLSPADTSDPRAELPGFLSHMSDAGLNSTDPQPRSRQIVQELFDNTGQWRQARVDLSTFAHESNIQLRFDFSTAGAMNDPSLGFIDDNFGEFSRNDRSIRSQDNQYEGFYIDDVVVGFAERGEMVTEPRYGDNRDNLKSSQTTDLFAGGSRTRNNDPDRNPDILNGQYQLEVRRAGEYAQLLDDGGVVVGSRFDTNDRHVVESTATASIDFEGALPALSVPTSITVDGTTYSGGDIQPWQPSSNAFAGNGALESDPGLGDDQAAVFQTTLSALTGGDTTAGNIRFAFRVSSEAYFDGLQFLIDGVEQRILGTPGQLTSGAFDLTFASGEVPYQIVQLPFGEGDHTFTWAYTKNFVFASGLDQAFIDDLVVLQGGTGLQADRNRERPQGVFIVESNFIRDSSVRGINVDVGTDQAGGNVPHPGSTINFPQTDPNRLVPGVVIQNNVVAGSSGVRFFGADTASPQTPVPFGKIVNNTFVGPNGGTGLEIGSLASPTVMNNIFAFFATGLADNGAGTEIRSNFFQENGNNGSVGTDAIVQAGSPDLFVDAAAGNYYLAATSQAVDSSLNKLQDRFDYANFKDALGIPPSPLAAPDRDVFGQKRVDSDTSPGGGGSEVFKDRGATDRSDSEAPFAELLVPVDNDVEGNDNDPNPTIVWQRDPFLDSMSILLGDGPGPNSPFEGTGVDGLTVDDPNDPAISQQAVQLTQNGQPLTEGVDYNLGYNALSGVLTLTPLSTLWEPQSVYVVTLDRTLIADRAGNLLRSNQEDGTTSFTILLGDFEFDYGDARDNSYGTLLASNGARHIVSPVDPLRLGQAVDTETDGQPSVLADGDDLGDQDDEDGLPIGTFQVGGSSATGLILEPGAPATTTDPSDVVGFLNPREQLFGTTLTVDVTGSGLLDAWVDFDSNGVFTDAGEQILTNHPVVDGGNEITVFAPTGTANGLKNARFRLSTAGDLAPTGLAIDGEVEDYRLRVANVNLPVPQDGNYTVDEDQVIASDFLPPPTIPLSPTVDPASLRYEILDDTGFGGLTLIDPVTGEFSYDSDEDFYGDDTFTYRVVGEAVVDGLTLPVRSTAIGTVTLSVTPLNDPPTAIDHAYQTIEPSGTSGPTAVTISEMDLLANAQVQDDADLRQTPWDEKEQDLKVVQIRVLDAAGNPQQVLTEPDGSPLVDPFLPIDGTYTADTHVNGILAGTLTVTVSGNAVTEVVYQPAAHYNEDNTQFAPGVPSLDGFAYTVTDDGATTLPSGDPAVPQPAPESVEATVTFQVFPSNDAPVAVDDAIPGPSWTGANPTEDTTLVIPPSFLLGNDAVGPVGADDELNGVDGNDGTKFLVTDPAILDTLGSGQTYPLTTAAGGSVVYDASSDQLEYVPPAEYYGPDSFTYWVGDEGIDQDVAAVTTSNPKYSEASVSLTVDPVNDEPLAIDHSHTILEDGSLTLTADQLSSGDALNLLLGAQADADPQIGSAPWDETNQALRVISLNIDGVTVDASNAASGPFAMPFGEIAVNFAGTTAGDALVDLTYTPNEHFNSANPPSGTLPTLEVFTYTVADDGAALVPPEASGTTIFQAEETATATVSIGVTSQNDPPQFNGADDVVVDEDAGETDPGVAPSDVGLTVIPNWINDIQAGPDGAGDENAAPPVGQTVVFEVVPDDPAAAAQLLVTDNGDPQISVAPDGTLEFRTLPDAYGTLSFTVQAIDDGNNDPPAEINTSPLVPFTITIDPVNDAPLAIDHSHTILEDGSLTLTAEQMVSGDPLALLLGSQADAEVLFNAAPWDETNQTLRVISLNVDGATVDAGNAASGPFATPYGEISATFAGTTAGDALVDLTYTPNQDFNSDNPLAGLARTLETFAYTVADDGAAIVPPDGSGSTITQPEETATATVTITVKPQNDAPVVGDDEISLGLPGSTAWDNFFAGGTAVAPTEDVSLVIPAAFLLSNDAVGPATAGDELNATNSGGFNSANDGTRFLVGDPSILDTLDPGLSFPLTTTQGGTVTFDSATGNLTYTPAADYYGPDSFTYWTGDEGVDEAVDGTRTANPLYSEATVSLVVEPVNDPPSTIDHSRVILEDGQVTLTAAELLSGAEVHFDPQIADAPWDESNQTLRVVSLTVDGTLVDATNAGSGPFATPHGTVSAIFNGTASGDALVSLTYTPNAHFNVDNPLTDVGGSLMRTFEAFTYTISDDGLAVLPQDPAGPPVAQPELTASATISIEVKPQNDTPVAGDDEISIGQPGSAAWELYFNGLPVPQAAPAPLEDTTLVIPTAFLLGNDAVGPVGTDDERNGVNGNDAPEFVVTDPATLDTLDPGYAFPLTTAQGGTVAINQATGNLEYTPALNYFGPDSFTYWISDQGVDEDVAGARTANPRFAEANVSLKVERVNDPPQLDAAVLGTSESFSSDEAWSVASNGDITFVLREDNTQAGGSEQLYTIDLVRQGSPTAYGRIGLLDVFDAGPINEEDGVLIPPQILDLFTFDTTTALGGSISLGVGSSNQPVLLYDPPQDLNRTFVGRDSFTYDVIDNGQTWRQGTGLESDPLTAANTVTFILEPVNDVPEFQLTDNAVAAFEDAGPLRFENLAVDIFAGPPATALDETNIVSGQELSFQVNVADPADQAFADQLFLDAPRIATDGTLEFTPATDAYGTVVFDVMLTDNGPDDGSRGDIAASASQPLTISIQPQNDAPRFANSDPVTFTLNEDNAFLIPLEALPGEPQGLLDKFTVGPPNEAANRTPGGNQTLSLAAPVPASTPAGGQLTPVTIGGRDFLRYVPKTHFNGSDSFIYSVTDVDAVSVDLDGNVSADPRVSFFSVDLQVRAINDAPQFAGASSLAVPEDAGEGDPAVDPNEIGLTVVPNWITNIQAGPVGAVDENLAPPAGQSVSFNVTPLDASEAASLFATENNELQVSVAPDGTLRFQTLADANGSASFTVQAIDDGNADPVRPGEVNRSALRTFTITVDAVNDAPTFTPGADVAVDEDSGAYNRPWAEDILPGPADEQVAQTVRFEVDVDPADLPLFQVAPQVADNGSLRFTPAPDAHGNVTVGVRAIDSEGGEAAAVDLTITIVPQPDRPIVQDDLLSSDEDTVLVIDRATVLANDSDPDLPDDQLTIVLSSNTTLSGAAVSLDADNNIVYDPTAADALQALAPQDPPLTDTFVYSVIDSTGRQSNAGTISLEISGINDAPQAVADSTDVQPGTPTILRPLDNDIDVDGSIDPTTLQVTLQPAFGSVSSVGDGTLIYTPFAGFRGSDLLRYVVRDDLGAVSQQGTITITSNEAPVAIDDAAGGFREEPLTISVLSNDNDPDGTLDPASLVITRPPEHGEAIPRPDGTVQYIPDDGFFGTDSFAYTVEDTQGSTSNVGQVSVRIVSSRLQNPNLQADVNNDGEVSPIDALLIINYLNSDLPTQVPPDAQGPSFVDVDGNRRVEPRDALAVINALNRRARDGQNFGEGEAVPSLTSTVTTLQDSPAGETGGGHADSVAKLVGSGELEVGSAEPADEVFELIARGQGDEDEEARTESLDQLWSEFEGLE